jgi:hypothetical protein
VPEVNDWRQFIERKIFTTRFARDTEDTEKDLIFFAIDPADSGINSKEKVQSLREVVN